MHTVLTAQRWNLSGRSPSVRAKRPSSSHVTESTKLNSTPALHNLHEMRVDPIGTLTSSDHCHSTRYEYTRIIINWHWFLKNLLHSLTIGLRKNLLEYDPT